MRLPETSLWSASSSRTWRPTVLTLGIGADRAAAIEAGLDERFPEPVRLVDASSDPGTDESDEVVTLIADLSGVEPKLVLDHARDLEGDLPILVAGESEAVETVRSPIDRPVIQAPSTEPADLVPILEVLIVVRTVRNLSQREKMGERVRALQQLPIDMADADDESQALEVALQRACQATGWSRGEAWVPRGEHLELAATWPGTDASLSRNVEEPTGEQLDRDDGVIVRAWRNGEAIWAEPDEDERTRALAGERGIDSVAAFPVEVGAGVGAVLVFYPSERGTEVRRFVEVIDSVAAHVGTVLGQIRTGQALRQRTNELEAANEELEAFARAISHDLREPLRTVEGMTHHVQERFGEELPEDAAYMIDRAQKASHRMNDLLEGLERLTRVARTSMNRRPVDLGEAARSIVDELKAQDPDHPATVRVETSATVNADPRMLDVLLQNLLENAWKFTRSVEDAEIVVATEETDGEVVHVVRDTGIGFNSQRADELFEPFRRLHADDEVTGTGIGLATVHRIVKGHGGEVWAEGAQGEGAAIYFTLPAPEEDTGAPAA